MSQPGFTFLAAIAWLSIGASVALLTGCGGGPEVAPVEGVITLRGKPIGPGEILFVPDAAQSTQGKAAVGHFKSDGVYTLTTFQSGDGALVGHHKVIIRPRMTDAEGGDEGPVDPKKLPPIPAKYGNLVQPILSAEVKRGGEEINFDLTP